MCEYCPDQAVIFTGDDVSKGNGMPGTDYFAMIQAATLARHYGIPVYTIHTHHPAGGALAGTLPDERLSAATLSEHYPAPPITLRVPTPRALAEIIVQTHLAAKRHSGPTAA